MPVSATAAAMEAQVLRADASRLSVTVADNYCYVAHVVYFHYTPEQLD
ncbi:MAG: hypothetical protein KDE47_28890 [Caldilineaceae bacterium]|nr:hypothetical protein [Planctomycetales bacterium]MCB0085005.1 hypothetical protein [Caldilineaceae bacterium]